MIIIQWIKMVCWVKFLMMYHCTWRLDLVGMEFNSHQQLVGIAELILNDNEYQSFDLSDLNATRPKRVGM